MNPIRTAVVISAMVAVGACGAASDGDDGLPDVVPTVTEVESTELRVARTGTTRLDASPRSAAPEIPDSNVVPTPGIAVPESEPSTTSTTVETIDIDEVLDALESLEGDIGQFDTEIESYVLEEEGVNP